MAQKKIPLINSAHGSDTRNVINELIKLFNSMGYTYNESLQKAQDVLNEAKQTNDMNTDVQQQINALIAESGTSDSEVLQARIDGDGNEYNVLKDRLDESDAQLAQTEQEVNKMMYAQYDDIFPDKLTDKLPFDLNLSGNGELTHNFNVSAIPKNPDITVYVDNQGGDDSNSGTKSNPYKTLGKAWEKINAGSWNKALIQASGEYDRMDIINDGVIPTGKTLSIIGDGDTLFYAGDKGTRHNWSADGTTYKASRTNCLNVIDSTVGEDENGVMPPMTRVDSVTACKNTPNSWYTDNSTVWVRTRDNRVPDDNVYTILFSRAFMFKLGANSTLYLENFKRYGGLNPDGGNGNGRFIQKNVKTSCAGYQTQGDGLAAVDVKESLSFDSIIAYSRADGFNYHYTNTSVSRRSECYAFEFNCKSYGNGTDAGDQASTQHEGVTIIRGNGEYNSQPGSAIVDVGGPLSVNINSRMTGGFGMGINVSGEGHELLLINSNATTELDGQYSVRAENAKMRGNIVKGIVSVTNLESL